MLLPLVFLSILSVTVTLQGHRQAEAAGQVAHDATMLQQLLTLRGAVFAERLAEEVSLPERRPPADLAARSRFLSLVAGARDRLVAESDRSLGMVDPAVRPFHQEELAAVRASSGQHDSAELIEQRWGPIERRLDGRIGSVLDRLRLTADVELSDPRLARNTDALDAALEVPIASLQLVGTLSNLWSAAEADRARMQSEFAAAEGNFERLNAELQTSQAPEIRELWSRTGVPPAQLRRSIWLGMAGELAQPSVPPDTHVEVGLGLIDGVDWAAQMGQVPATAVDVERAQADLVSEDARRDERTTALLTLIAVVASIASALLYGRSIVTPVRRLTDQAIRVGRGDLSVEPLELSGPPEVVRASDAFNDVVDNLVLLERKARALAECDFSDPALDEPLPGDLGASLQRSVKVLSGSIVERQNLQERLAYQANHDPLTKLANRAGLLSRLFEVHDARRAGDGTELAVMFIDLDGFKRTNDRYGHAVGDDLLRVVSERLSAQVREDALVARMGGDEFVVLLPSVADPSEPVVVAERLAAAVAEPIDLDGLVLSVGACVGLAVTGSGRDYDNPTDLLRFADIAVYAAKATAGRQVVLYDDEMDRSILDQKDLEDGLAEALESDDQLRLVFQPVIDATSGAPVGFEALVRWRRGALGEVSPGVFVPVAERSSLVVELDRWVLRRGVAQLGEWEVDRNAVLSGIGLSVNVSGRSLMDPKFVADARQVISNCSFDPELLTLEVTETALVTDLDLAAEQLRALRATGVRIAIDDFGTGYTSVAQLRVMPMDEIKIDSTFVHGLPDEEQRDLIQMITDLAHRLGVPTVAEGVETSAQHELLCDIGCDWMQGYLFAAPMEPHDLVSWIQGHRRARSLRDPAPVGDARPVASSARARSMRR